MKSSVKLCELYKKYVSLEKSKMYAIKKAISRFYSVPLEEQDMECCAWKAFLEVEKKYKSDIGNKSYDSFFIDCLYWKVKDYCVKYSSNGHKVCNLSYQSTVSNYGENITNHFDSYQDESIIKRLIIEDYINTNKDNFKSTIISMYQNDYSVEKMCSKMDWSKTTLYKHVDIVRTDLGVLLGKRTTNCRKMV